MLIALLQGISFATAPILSVGPFKIFVLSTAVRQGWRRALPLALVPLIADIPVILLLWFVLQQFPDWAVHTLRLLGGLYYFYLARGLVRLARQPPEQDLERAESRRSFVQAIGAVWITPNVYINWSIIGIPALLAYAAESTLHAAMFLIGFYALWVPGLAIQIFIFGQAKRVSYGGSRALILLGSLLLAAFGAYQLWLGVSGLLGS